MRRIGTIAVIVGLLGLVMWSCGDDGTSTGPEPSNGAPPTTADYAVWGTMMTIGWEGIGKRVMTSAAPQTSTVMVGVQKNDGTEDVSNWPDQKATEVKLIGPREITLTEMAFGGMIDLYFEESRPGIGGPDDHYVR